MFLESMHRRRDKFMTWMTSHTFLESRFANMDEWKFAHSCLSSLTWWDTMEFILNGVESLYAFLRFTDQDKVPNLSEVLYCVEWIWKSVAWISHWLKEVLVCYPTLSPCPSDRFICECRYCQFRFIVNCTCLCHCISDTSTYVQLMPCIQGHTMPMALQWLWWMTFDKHSSSWRIQTRVSRLFKELNTIEGNNDLSHRSWLQRWHVTIIHLQENYSVILVVASQSHSEYW
jgi:hypothetical protein